MWTAPRAHRPMQLHKLLFFVPGWTDGGGYAAPGGPPTRRSDLGCGLSLLGISCARGAPRLLWRRGCPARRAGMDPLVTRFFLSLSLSLSLSLFLLSLSLSLSFFFFSNLGLLLSCGEKKYKTVTVDWANTELIAFCNPVLRKSEITL